jgi:hypothetical protein
MVFPITHYISLAAWPFYLANLFISNFAISLMTVPS